MVSLIKELLDWQQLSPTQFADRIGIGRPVISHILSERNKPSLEVIKSIKVAFPQVSTDWLLGGSGPMLAAEAVAATPPASTTPETGPTPADPAPSPAGPTEPSPGETPAPTESPLGSPAAAPKAAPTQAPPPAPAAPLPALARFRAGKSAVQATPPPIFAEVVAPAALVTAPLPEAALVEPAVGARATSPALAAPVAPAPVVPAVATIPHSANSDAVATPVQSLAAPLAVAAGAALAQSLAEPGKVIRRIVIFYRDGSFADYQPE